MHDHPKVTELHAVHALERSHKWPGTRTRFLRSNPACAACGRGTWLQVHHVLPFHLCVLVAKRPDLELDPRNLITLCEPPGDEGCHARLGHLGDYRVYNPDVRADAVTPARRAKPPVLARMTASDRRRFRALTVRLYGRAAE